MTITRHPEPVTTTNAPVPPRSRRWVWVGAVLLMICTVIAAWVIGRSGGSTTPPPPVAAAPATVTVAAPGGEFQYAPSDIPVAGQPDGCLGGADPYTAVLPAQQAATLDEAGAASFARAAVRYLLKPYPAPDDFETVLPALFTDPAGPLEAARHPQAAQEPPPDGTTTKYVRPAETTYVASVLGDRADVTVAVYLELDYPGDTFNQVRLTQRLLMQAVDGHWKITAAPPTDSMPEVGTGGVRYFPGGC